MADDAKDATGEVMEEAGEKLEEAGEKLQEEEGGR
jgi:hypothetical protein